MTDPTRPPSWYADPTGRHQYRYWNGTEWTDQVADDQVTSTDPATMPSGDPVPGAPPAPVAPGPVPAGATKRTARPVFGWIAVVGGVALAVGAFLDSVSASAGEGVFGVTIDQSYMDGDGAIELVLGIGIVVLGLVLALGVLPRWGGWIVVGAGALGAIIAVADIIDVQDKLDQLRAVGGDGSIGPALWVCLVGGVIATVGGAGGALSSND
jgi:hypothetical protein